MSSSAALRTHIEALLARRIPSALSPHPQTIRPVLAAGVEEIDELLGGGLPRGAVTELIGREGSGLASFALSFLARITQKELVCAWVDVSDRLHPESAAAIGVDLNRLLWVRCGISPGMTARKPWRRMDQALRVTDLLLQAGGFGAVVLDMGDIAPEHATRVPLAVWFRYRAAAERSQTSVLLLTQHSSAKSAAGLVLHFEAGEVMEEGMTFFAGVERRIAIERDRFTPNGATPGKKPARSERSTSWRSLWAGTR